MKKKVLLGALVLTLISAVLFATTDASATVEYSSSSVTVKNPNSGKGAKNVEGDVCVYLERTVSGKTESSSNDEHYGPISPGGKESIHVPKGWTVTGASIKTCRVDIPR